MKHQEITIAGKAATLAYCYATEIAFKDLAKKEVDDFITEVDNSLKAKRMPDIKNTIYLIVSSLIAYYDANGQETPVRDIDIMQEATPSELGIALGTVIKLRSEFYALPAGEPSDTPAKGKGGKKRKNV